MTDSAPATLAPIAGAERIQALDVIRGFALIGIFLMNVEFFTRPLQDINGDGIDAAMHGLDYVADALVYFFVQSKFWTLFSLLFGMGFAVMIERAERAGRAFLPVYLRRTLALLAIGLGHALLIWSGDILVSYALAAFVLLLARQARRAHLLMGWQSRPAPMSAGRLAAWGTSLYGLALVLLLAFGALGSLQAGTVLDSHDESAQSSHADEQGAERERAVQAYSQGSYADAVRQRVRETNDQLSDLPEFLPLVLGVFLIGAAVIRSGWLRDIRANAGRFRTVRDVGLPLGFGLMAISVRGGTSFSSGQFHLSKAITVVTYLAAGLVLALAYGATVVTLLNTRVGPWLQRWLAPAGRMTLSNYLAQSVIGTLVFYQYGLGNWGQVGRAGQVLFVAVVFTSQLLFSRWWLARFNYGPMEWLWRAVTYWQWPAMRRLQ